MSLRVISGLASGASTAVSAANASGGDGLPGEFAALLSGELSNLLVMLPGASEKVLADLETDQSRAGPGSSEAIQGLVDPALIASLTGNTQLQPEISIREGAISQAASDKTEKSVAGNAIAMLDGHGSAVPAEQESSRAAAKAASAAFEKLSQAGNNTANASTSLHSGAANIAVEVPAPEPNATLLTGAMSAVAAGRQSPEAQSAHQQNIGTHLRDASWPQQFGEKIVWLARNDQQTAQININPPQLGPVQITINLSGDQATVAFASPHPEVRQAIESALPQLKELLSAAGINLGQADVGANLAKQNPDNPSQSANGNRLANENAILRANENAAGTGASAVLQRGRGMVDLFA